MKMIFDEPFFYDYCVKESDCDKSGNMRLSAFQSCMLESATGQCRLVERDIDSLLKIGLTWVISKIKIHFYRFPKLGDKLRIFTWPIESGKFAFDRDFRVELESGKKVAEASSRWCVINYISRRPVSKETIEFPESTVKSVLFEDAFRPVVEPTSYLGESEHVVLKDEIDVNKHLNNTKYFDIAADAIKNRVGDFGLPKNISVHFVKEIRLGEKLRLFVGKNGNNFVVKGLNDNGHVVFLFDYCL